MVYYLSLQIIYAQRWLERFSQGLQGGGVVKLDWLRDALLWSYSYIYMTLQDAEEYWLNEDSLSAQLEDNCFLYCYIDHLLDRQETSFSIHNNHLRLQSQDGKYRMVFQRG